MDKKLAFQILGLSETKEEEQIRQSYLTLLKGTNPEDDPEGFKRLREAYEEALRFARQQDEEDEEEPQGEIGLWMKRVREIYRDILLRREAENWKALLMTRSAQVWTRFWKQEDSFSAFWQGILFCRRLYGCCLIRRFM